MGYLNIVLKSKKHMYLNHQCFISELFNKLGKQEKYILILLKISSIPINLYKNNNIIL